jgi:OOP family OmpA-OmpF porin
VAAVQFSAQLIDGRLILAGTASSDLERLALVQRAAGAVDPANVANQLTVDGQAPPVPADSFTSFLDLLVLMPRNLVTAQLAWNGDKVVVGGSYADDAARAVFGDAAARVGVAAALTERSTATAPQAAALEAELNALVASEPILFDKGSTNISVFSVATVQKVAGMAKRYAGVAIEVQGHTDSEGDPGRNLTLSEQRAGSVRDALVALGVPAADLTAKGFGMTQLITDSNGNEIPDKSRRVVFGVTVI